MILKKRHAWMLRFPMKSSANDFIGKNSVGVNSINQMAIIVKFPIGINPKKFICKLFESNSP
jgi:hypothetical protein